MVAVPACPSLVAVIVAVPSASAVIAPFASIDATAVLLELHVTVRPVNSLLLASKVFAVACDVPTAVIELADNATVTVATGAAETVIDDVPLFPSLVAVMVAEPAPTAVTRPLFASTVAAAVLFELHWTDRPVSNVPFPSFVTAVSCTVGVTTITRFADPGVTSTVATGAGVTVICAPPVLPSLAAMMFDVPAPTAVTSPVVADTVATAVLLELQVTARFVSERPLESSNVAVACEV